MANLTQIVEKLADKQIDVYQILGAVTEILYQHEEAIGGNPNKQKFEEITSRIDTASQQVDIDRGYFQQLASTPFDQPPAPPAEEPPAP